MLSRRELEILAAIADGSTDKEIANRLFIAPATVRKHLTSLHGKLGANGRRDAVRIARSLGWAPPTVHDALRARR